MSSIRRSAISRADTSVPLPTLSSSPVTSDAIAATFASATSATWTKSKDWLPSPAIDGASTRRGSGARRHDEPAGLTRAVDVHVAERHDTAARLVSNARRRYSPAIFVAPYIVRAPSGCDSSIVSSVSP